MKFDVKNPSNGPTYGIVLAGGAGSRYGKPKILVGNWLERAVTALQIGGCNHVCVVTGAARPNNLHGATEVHCPEWERGIGASLRSGLESVPTGSKIVIHLVDCPDVSPAVVRRTLSRSHSDVTRATFKNVPGHPVVISGKVASFLIPRLNTDSGANKLLERFNINFVECGDLATGKDIDRPTHQT